MPHRNADGTFASGNGYDDLEVQTVNTQMFTNSGTITDALEEFAQFNTFEPVGGLSRNEVAELVYLQTNVSLQITGTSDATAGCHAHVLGELSSDPELNATFLNASDRSEQDVDGITGVDAYNNVSNDPEVLQSHAVGAHAESLDDTNGSGSGASGSTLSYDRPYRKMFGHGPTFDRHDDIFVHLGYNSEGTSQPDVEYYDKMTMVWDVREID